MMDAAMFFADRFGHRSTNATLKDLPPEVARILGRRTHRVYKDCLVSENLIEILLAVAFSASSKSDFQQASVIRVKDIALRAGIGELFPSMPWIGASPVFLVFCGDSLRLEKLGALRGYDQSNRNTEGFLNAAVDAALTMQTFVLAAEAVGLGCCPISVIRNKAPKIAQLLELPHGVFPIAGLCVGYPKKAGHISMRLPMSVTVHEDRYDGDRLVREIESYDVQREAINPTPPEKQRNVNRFGVRTRYGWSEDKARQAAEPEGHAFAQYICDTGFVLSNTKKIED